MAIKKGRFYKLLFFCVSGFTLFMGIYMMGLLHDIGKIGIQMEIDGRKNQKFNALRWCQPGGL